MQVLCHTSLISSPAQMSFPHLHTTTKPSVLQTLGNLSRSHSALRHFRETGWNSQPPSLSVLTLRNDAVSISELYGGRMRK
jgi:hypothetical protein